MTHRDSTVCALHPPGYEHRPTGWDVEGHHVWPLGMGGPDVPSNVVLSCAGGHSDVHALLRMAVKAGGMAAVPWEVRRQFGLAERHYARLGYAAVMGDVEVRRYLSDADVPFPHLTP